MEKKKNKKKLRHKKSHMKWKKEKTHQKFFSKEFLDAIKKNSDEKGNTKTNAFLLQDSFFSSRWDIAASIFL